MSSLAKIIGAVVDDNGALLQHSVLAHHKRANTHANDALGANELDELVGHGSLGVALGVRLEVPEVTDVTVRISGRTMLLVERVDWKSSVSLI
jgi:hypothetical protein